jgi:hypothetical protein
VRFKVRQFELVLLPPGDATEAFAVQLSSSGAIALGAASSCGVDLDGLRAFRGALPLPPAPLRSAAACGSLSLMLPLRVKGGLFTGHGQQMATLRLLDDCHLTPSLRDLLLLRALAQAWTPLAAALPSAPAIAVPSTASTTPDGDGTPEESFTMETQALDVTLLADLRPGLARPLLFASLRLPQGVQARNWSSGVATSLRSFVFVDVCYLSAAISCS